MNIVKSGNMLQVYGSSIETFTKLPVGTYGIGFSKMTGFFLTRQPNLVLVEKMYGSSVQKIDKVFDRFAISERNFGIILSGRKGAGKSMFARALSLKGLEMNLPTIIVDTYIPGIANFLASIEQEVIVLFDEFEKSFKGNDDCNPQEEMLSLFDGLDGGKKLFVITCNETDDLNEFLVNRPGRFHYHFKMGTVEENAIEEYLTDNLKEEYHSEIPRITSLRGFVHITYDILRAFVFEINNGSSLREAIDDLNIEVRKYLKIRLTVTLENGLVFSHRGSTNISVDLSNPAFRIGTWLLCKSKNPKYATAQMNVNFYSKNIKIKDNKIVVDPQDIEYDFECGDMESTVEEDKKLERELSQFKIKDISVEQIITDTYKGKYLDV